MDRGLCIKKTFVQRQGKNARESGVYWSKWAFEYAFNDVFGQKDFNAKISHQALLSKQLSKSRANN